MNQLGGCTPWPASAKQVCVSDHAFAVCVICHFLLDSSFQGQHPQIGGFSSGMPWVSTNSVAMLQMQMGNVFSLPYTEEIVYFPTLCWLAYRCPPPAEESDSLLFSSSWLTAVLEIYFSQTSQSGAVACSHFATFRSGATEVRGRSLKFKNSN